MSEDNVKDLHEDVNMEVTSLIHKITNLLHNEAGDMSIGEIVGCLEVVKYEMLKLVEE